MKKLSNTEAELKKTAAYKKKRVFGVVNKWTITFPLIYTVII